MKKSYRDYISGFMYWLGFNMRNGVRTLSQATDKMKINCFLVNPDLQIEEIDPI